MTRRDGLTLVSVSMRALSGLLLAQSVFALAQPALAADTAELTRQVGETDTLVLHVGEAEDPQPLADALKGLPGVTRADVTDHEVTIITPAAEELLAPAVTRANEMGIKIHSIDIREPNLEAVFLHLTGRALRD